MRRRGLETAVYEGEEGEGEDEDGDGGWFCEDGRRHDVVGRM